MTEVLGQGWTQAPRVDSLGEMAGMSNKDGRIKVLFVCVGNACRSPMAEAIARVDAPDAIEAFSAGLAPIESVAGMTKQTLMKNGYSVEGLEPKGISTEVLEQAEIVINLSGRVREQAFRDCSNVRDWEIEDPFGKDIEAYQQVFEKIRLHVTELGQECRKKRAEPRSGERRAHARLWPASPIFVSLNGVGGGIASNISEEGLALSAAEVLPDGPLNNMRIQFPGSPDWIEASGEVVWKGKSNQEAGVRFVGLTEESYLQIRGWISSQAFLGDFPEQMGRILETQDMPLEGSGILKTNETNPESYPRKGKQTGSKAFSSRLRRAPGRKWGTFTAAGVMIGLISLTFEWVTMRRDVQTETTATITQKTGVSNKAIQDLMLAPVSDFANAAGAGDSMRIQARSAEPLLAEEHARIPEVSLDDVQARALQRRSASAIVKTPTRPIRSALGQSFATNEPRLARVTMKSPALTRVQPLPVGSLPATSTRPEVQTAPPLISTSNLASDSPPIGLKELKIPPPPPRQPVAPGSMTAAVAIVADPYPSLRIPDGGISKKQGQATSLQLGHLVSRVEPIYPEAAKQQGVQGTVKLHAIIGRQGAVENLESVDGSPVLAAAAVNAVRQWRYSETLLAGRSVETEENIAITFRLSNTTSPID